MIKMLGRLQVLALTLFSFSTALAYKSEPRNQNDQHPSGQSDIVVGDSRVAACAPATGLRNIEWNNVKALIETGGSMWQDRANSRAAYVVPKDGGVSSIYAGALWMGGISPDQQLKIAAVTFRADGNDY